MTMKRFLSLLMCAVMVLVMLPATALADTYNHTYAATGTLPTTTIQCAIGQLNQVNGSPANLVHIKDDLTYSIYGPYNLNTTSFRSSETGWNMIPTGETNTYYLQTHTGGYLKRTGSGYGSGLTTTQTMSDSTKWTFEQVNGTSQFYIKDYSPLTGYYYLDEAWDGTGKLTAHWYLDLNNYMDSFFLYQKYLNSDTGLYQLNATINGIKYTAISYGSSYSAGFYLPCSTPSNAPITVVAEVTEPTSRVSSVTGTALSNGSATVRVTVTAENGATQTYALNFTTQNHTITGTTTIDVYPTCTTAGSQSYHCTVCGGHAYPTAIPALGHSWNTDYTIDQAATCTVDGSKSIHCSRCPATKDVTTIPALGHSWNSDYTVDQVATCTVDGSKSYHCSRCPETSGTTVIPATGHSLGDWTTVLSPDCVNTGSEQRKCANCTYTETRDLDALGHTWEADYTIDQAATCTVDGSKSIHCSVCPAVKDSTVISATGHTAGDWIVDTAATCTASGSQHKECTVCGEPLGTGVIAATGHTESGWITDIAATCTTAGLQHTECTACHITMNSGTISETGHTSGGWIVDSTATCTVNGSQHQSCTVCGVTLATEMIPATGHAYGSWTTVDSPSCTNTGSQRRVCSVCGYTETRELDATGHTWEAGYTVDQAATCTADGSQSIHCEDCGARRDSMVIPATGHDYDTLIAESTCTEQGYTEYTCRVCGYTYTDNLTAALGHAWDEGAITQAPTETTGGMMTYTCTRCGETKTEAIAALGVGEAVSITPGSASGTGDVTVVVNVSALPEGTQWIQTPEGELIAVSGSDSTVTFTVGEEDVNSDGTIDITVYGPDETQVGEEGIPTSGANASLWSWIWIPFVVLILAALLTFILMKRKRAEQGG